MISKPYTIEASAGGVNAVAYLTETEYYLDPHGVKGKASKPRDPSHWHGAGATALKIDGDVVDAHVFENILNGFTPNGKNRLTKNAGSKSREKLGVDCVTSPPKSVSIAAALAPPKLRAQIIQALENANAESMKYFESVLTIRTGAQGAELQPVTGLVIGSFQHVSSRAWDMDEHIHNCIAMAAMRKDGTWGNLDRAEIMTHHHAAGAIYRAELARSLNALGFTIEADIKNDFSFNIAGISAEAIEAFSQERTAILKFMADHNLNPHDSEAAQRAAKAVRKAKNEPPFKDLQKIWQTRAAAFGLDADKIESLTHGAKQVASIDVEFILAELTEKKSVFERKDVLKAVAIAASRTGGMTCAECEFEVDKILCTQAFNLGDQVRKSDRINDALRQGQAIKLGTYTPEQLGTNMPPQKMKRRHLYTTPETIKRETDLYRAFEQARDDHRHDRITDQIDAAQKFYESEMSEKYGKEVKMKPEQLAMLNHCAGAGAGVIIQGLSGTGKSFACGSVRVIEEAAGQKVHAIALSANAARELKEGAGIKNGGTLESALRAIGSGKLKLSEKDTIILDECAMVGARQMLELINAVKAAGAKLCCVGDKLQYQAIESGGGWFGGLQDLGFQYAQLNDIERQKLQWHRNAVIDLKDGNGAKALTAFAEHGLLKIEASQERALKQLARDFANDSGTFQDKIAMASLHTQTRIINAEVRRLLIERGALGMDAYQIEFSAKDGLTHFLREIRNGERLRFTKNKKKIGDANCEAVDVRNGDLGTIKNIARLRDGDVELTMALDNGKTIKFKLNDYDFLEHGYAQTGMGSQGASRARAYTFLDAEAMSKQAAYVLNSRSKQETTIYAAQGDCEDIAAVLGQLGQAMSRDASADWTLDYLSPKQTDVIPALIPKPESAPALIIGSQTIAKQLTSTMPFTPKLTATTAIAKSTGTLTPEATAMKNGAETNSPKTKPSSRRGMRI